MTRGGGPLAAILGILILSLGPRALAVDFGSGPVLLIADEVRYDQEAGVVSAEGNVEITRGGRRLLADSVRYDQRADQMRAVGDVILLEPAGEALFADEVVLTGDLRDGVVQQLRARLTDESRFAAAQARRVGGERLEMDRAVYSPCRLCPDSDAPPLWRIRARRVVHDQEERTITYRHAFFDLYGVPVGYTPYFSHPDPTVERKSGFLAPSIGSDSELGLTLETPYYFALAPNYDLTLTPIVTTEEGPVLASEYRHLLDNGRFEIGGSGTYASKPVDDPDNPPDGKTFRGHLEGEGRFALANDWRTGYDLMVATDDTYLQRYDFSNRNILNNRLYAEQIWDRNYLAINGYGFQGLRATDEQGLIPIVIPLAELELASDPLRFGSRFTLDGSVVALTRTDGLDTRRLSTTGAFELPWLGPIGDRSRLALELRGDFYQTDGDPVTLADDGTNTEGRVFPRATLDWSWPLIGETLGWTSVIEPVTSVSVAPSGLNDDDIPNEDSLDLEFDDTNLFEEDRFPGLDRVDDGGKISYGLRFGAFGESGELLNLLFGQSYRFYGDEIFSPQSGLDDGLSDYVGRVELTPDPFFSLRYRFRLDRASPSLLRNEVRADIGPPRVRFDVSYLSLEDDPVADDFREREEITAGVLVRATDSVSLRGVTRRNLVEDQAIAHTFGLVYRNPCLLLVAGVERRYTENRDAGEGLEFSVRVTFKNLGELGAEASAFSF